MAVRTFPQYLKYEIERRAQTILRLAKLQKENIDFLILRMEREGASGVNCSQANTIANGVAEIARETAVLDAIIETDKQRVGFKSIGMEIDPPQHP